VKKFVSGARCSHVAKALCRAVREGKIWDGGCGRRSGKGKWRTKRLFEYIYLMGSNQKGNGRLEIRRITQAKTSKEKETEWPTTA
jgi:hypothetical protein